MKNDIITLEEVPADMIAEIFSRLSCNEVIALMRLSKRFSVMLKHNTIWREISRRTFGVTAIDVDCKSWFDYFNTLVQRFRSWSPEAHHPSVQIHETGKIAQCDPECKYDTHLPIRGRQGIKEGKFYFEVSYQARVQKTAFSSLLCAIGVVDDSMPTDRKIGSGFTKDNNGIGYYSSGFQFAYGVDVGGTRATYKDGNLVGLMLDMTLGEVQFFKDGVPVGPVHKLKREALGTKEVYPVVLVERGVTVTIAPPRAIKPNVSLKLTPPGLMNECNREIEKPALRVWSSNLNLLAAINS